MDRLRQLWGWAPEGLEPYEATRTRTMWRVLWVLAVGNVLVVPVQIAVGPPIVGLIPLLFVLQYLSGLWLIQRGLQQLAGACVVFCSLVSLVCVFGPLGGLFGTVTPFVIVGAVLAVLWLEPVPATVAVAGYIGIFVFHEPLTALWGGLRLMDPQELGTAMTVSLALATVLCTGLVGATTDALETAQTAANLRAHEARQAEEEAHRASEVKSRFLANMSHELRTPLNAILGYSDLLREDAASGEDEDLARIQRAGQQLLALVEDVLEVARSERAPPPPVFAPVDVSLALDERLREARQLSWTPLPAVEVRREAGLDPHIRSDPAVVGRVVANLLMHALRQGTRSVGIALRSTSSHVSVEIDCGAAPGGLGIALSERLAHPIGGEVEAQPHGDGTLLRLKLPRTRKMDP